MEKQKLSFLDDGQSIASAVSQLHDYFTNTYASYQVKRAQLVSHIEEGTAEAEANRQQLQQLDQELTLFGVLKDALGIADSVLHASTVARALGTEAEVYQVHREDEAEQAAERKAAERRVSGRPS